MKLQCSCGAKYEFEITPDLARGPVRFICPACGTDASALVTSLIQQQLGQTPTGSTGVSPVTPAPPAKAPPLPPPYRPGARLGQDAQAAAQKCPRHPGEVAVERCHVCGKPICARCMALFGYVCGPHCKAQAEARRIQVPDYKGLKSAVEARLWRNTGRIAWGGAGLLVALLVFWGLYEFWLSRPRVAFSVRYSDRVYSGQSAFAEPGQIVFLRGGLLARHDLKSGKEIWSRQVIDEQEIAAGVAQQTKEMQAAVERARQTDPDNAPRMPSPDRLRAQWERDAAAALELRVRGQNIWILSPRQMVRYDWASGKPVTEFPLPPGAAGFIARGDELLLMEQGQEGKPCVTYVNLRTCEQRTETMNGERITNSLGADVAAATARRGAGLAGLPVGMPGRDAGKPMDPAKVAQQASHMSFPARIALPAILANARNQEAALNEMKDSSTPRAAAPAMAPDSVAFVPAPHGFLQFSTRLLERKTVTRSAMKAPPTKSVLSGALTVGNTGEAANEILNDMQRSRGGDVVEEDQSRYQVKLQSADGAEGWTEEVVGPPALFPLNTVNVVAGRRSIVVLDKHQHALWQRDLGYDLLGAGPGAWDSQNGRYGQGPCVEHKGVLYVFDAGELTALDLATGNVRWRLPSVGVAGIFFDDQDNLYVNSTTADLDSIRFSRQIDITKKIHPEAFKIQASNGKILWRVQPEGLISYVGGKFIYTVASYAPEEPDPDSQPLPETGFEPQPYVRIKRLNPGNGRPMWEWYDDRAPVDVQFDKNSIRLVFKREVMVLKYWSF